MYYQLRILIVFFVFSVSADLLEVREPAIFIEFENIPLERIGTVFFIYFKDSYSKY